MVEGPRRCLAVLLGVTLAEARSCNLWQVVNQDASAFSDVSGVLNDKYALELKGSWKPAISGKMLQSFEGGCPSRSSELEGVSFTLSSSSSEPILVDYSQVKAGPATIGVSELRAAMQPTTFVATKAACTGETAGGGWCFSGTVVVESVSGIAHVLGHDFDLAGQQGTFDIAGFLEPDEQQLGLKIVRLAASFEVATDAVHGPFNLKGYLSSAAELPYSFEFDELRAEAASALASRPRGLSARATLGALVAGVCAAALVAARRWRLSRRAAAPHGDARRLGLGDLL